MYPTHVNPTRVNLNSFTPQNLPTIPTWRSCLRLLILLVALCWGAFAHATSDTWSGLASGLLKSPTNTWWTTPANWVGNAAPTLLGDTINFGTTTNLVPNNNFTNLGVGSINLTTNGYTLSGSSIQLTNGITDSAGSNTISMPLTLGAIQTFQNSSGNQSTNTISGTINLYTNILTIGGSAPIFLTGIVSSTNGGELIFNNSSRARLSAANIFGTNVVQITNLFSGAGTYMATTNIFTNTFAYDVMPGGYTNIYYVTNIVSSTNGTIAYTTNYYDTSVVDAVKVLNGATLQLANGAAVPSGANVGDFSLIGTLDLNGNSVSMSGLEDDGTSTGFIDNLTNALVYTVTFGNGNSNAVFNGTIGNALLGGATAGTIGVAKIGWGTQTLNNGNYYAGSTVIEQGTLKLGSSGSLGQNSPVLNIWSGATLDVTANPNGYQAPNSLTVSAGTPSKPYTNYLGSYDPNYGPNYTVSIATNTLLTYYTNVTYNGSQYVTNVVAITNATSATYTTNSIISVVNYDVKGNFVVAGNGGVQPIATVPPFIGTWSINGDLTLDDSLVYQAPTNINRVSVLLNTTTTPGGGTNSLITATGTLYVGDTLEFDATPVGATVASGKYTLISASAYVPHGNYGVDGDNNGATLTLVAPRGILGTFDTTSVAGSILLQVTGGTASPATLIWNGTPANENWDVHVTQNWLNIGVSDYFFAEDNVIFNDSGVGTINLANTVRPSSVIFNNSKTNYTFAENPGLYITGPSGIVKNGTGSVTLQNPNSFTGDVTVNGGLLNLGYYSTSVGAGNGGGFSSGQSVLYNGVPVGNLVLGGGTISELEQVNTPALAAFQNLTINPGASAVYQTLVARASSDYPEFVFSNNVIRNTGGVVDFSPQFKAGNYMGIFFTSTNSPDGTNDYGTNGILGGWATIFLNDWVRAVSPTRLASGSYAYNLYEADNNWANWGANSNVLVGNSSVPVTITLGSSKSIYTLRFTNTQPTTINVGGGQTLTLNGGGILIPAAGAIQDSIVNGTLEGDDLVVLNQNNTPGASLTIGSVIADNNPGTALTTAGGGLTILTGNNTYTGPTYIDNGYAGAAAGTLQVGANGTSGSIATSSAIVDNGSLAFNRSDNDSFSGVISGIGNLTKLSGGVLTLTTNNTLSGLVIVTAGTLQLGNGAAAGSVSNAVGIVNNATLVFDNSVIAGYSQPISGYGNLVQFGGGTLIDPTNWLYTGNTTVSNGTLKLTATGSISNTPAIAINSLAILDVSLVPGGLTLTAPGEVLSGSGIINGSVATANGTSLAPGMNGAIGTLTINNNLNLNGGSFNFAVGNSSSDRINVGGSLTETAGTVVISVTGGPLLNGVYPLIHATGGVPAVNPPVVGLFGFNQPGQIGVLTNEASGNLSLLVYTGTTPSLTWWGDGSVNAWDLASTANWTNVTGGPLVTYVNSDYATINDSGSASPPIDIKAGVTPLNLIVTNNTANFVLGANAGSAGKITGGASLEKDGTAQLNLQTTNNYLGATIINGGLVQLGNNTAQAEDGTLGAGAVTLAAGSTLVASNFATEIISGPISGSGTLVQAGAGKLVLAGNNSGFSGPITFTNSYLQVGNGLSGTLGTGTVTNNRTLLFDVGPTPVSTVNVAANITGSGGITNLGPGVVVLSGTNTFGGSVANDSGTIRLGSSGALPVTTGIFMDDNNSPGAVGTLDLNGYSATVASLQGNNTGNGNATLVEAQIVNNGFGTATLSIGGGTTTTFNGQLLDNNNGGSGILALLVTNTTSLTINACYNSLSAFPYPNLFSGGITISNASVTFGTVASATPTAVGTESAGIGSVSLWGGLGTFTNNTTRFPTNAMIYAAGNGGSTTPTINTAIGVLNVPSGQYGTLFLPARGEFDATLQGSGTLIVQPQYVRGKVGGDWSGFTGTIVFESVSGTSGDGGFTITSPLGYPQATLYMQVANNNASVSVSGGNGGSVFPIGALTGGDSTSLLGGGTQGNGSSGGAANTIWAIGGLGLSTTNGSQIVDGGCGIRKVGNDILALTNNVLSFGGQCVVSNGTLQLIPLGNNPGGFSALTNNYLQCSNFTIVSPGILDISQAGGTLYLGHGAISQSLFGDGTINGSLITTNNLIAPAWGASGRGTWPGQLSITGTASINGSTIQMAVNRTSTPENDSIVANTNGTSIPTPPTINTASFVVINGGDTAFAGGTTNVFQFFNASVPVNLGAGNTGITNITVFTNLPAGMFWVTNLNGTLAGYPTVPGRKHGHHQHQFGAERLPAENPGDGERHDADAGLADESGLDPAVADQLAAKRPIEQLGASGGQHGCHTGSVHD